MSVAKAVRYSVQCAFSGALLLNPIRSAAAQTIPRVVVRDQVTCSTCRIVFDSIATLGDRAGPGIIENERSWVVRDSRGRHYVFFPYATQIKVFDSVGTYLRSIGRKGGGPGEFDAVAGVQVSSGDSIHVLDWGLSRHSIFAPDFTSVRGVIVSTQPQLRWILLPDGRIVVNANIRMCTSLPTGCSGSGLSWLINGGAARCRRVPTVTS